MNKTFHFNNLILFISMAVWCNILSAISKPQEEFVQIDPLCKIYPESRIVKPFHALMETARGEEVHFQFVIQSDSPIRIKKCVITPRKGSEALDSLHFQIGYEGFVGVKRLSKEAGKYSFIPSSHLVPDPIFDSERRVIPAQQNQPIWLSAHIPEKFYPGTYHALVIFQGTKGKKNIQFTDSISIKVYPVTLKNEDLNISNQFSYDSGRYGFNNGKWSLMPFESDMWFQYMKETARLLRRAKTNTILLNPEQFVAINQSNGKYSFDFTKFDQVINLFIQEKVLKNIESGHLGRRSGGWYSNFVLSFPVIKNNGETKWDYAPVSDKRVRNFYRQFLPALDAHLKKTFPNIQNLQHIADEPIKENAQSYIDIAKFFKNICPDITLFDAIKTPSVAKYIDIPVPELDVLKENSDYFEQLISGGKQVWFYTCWQPQGNYANRFLEQPLLMVRLLHWINFKYQLNGYLHWGFNRWGENNPYQETTQPSGDDILPGGDSYMIYPSDSLHLFSSIRLEAMRDGVNDYQLFKMLAKKEPSLAEQICDQVILDWDSYNLDPNHFREIRHQLLVALSNK